MWAGLELLEGAMLITQPFYLAASAVTSWKHKLKMPVCNLSVSNICPLSPSRGCWCLCLPGLRWLSVHHRSQRWSYRSSYELNFTSLNISFVVLNLTLIFHALKITFPEWYSWSNNILSLCQVDFSLARFAWLTVINEDQLEPCPLTIIIHLIKLNMIVLAFKCVFMPLKLRIFLWTFFMKCFSVKCSNWRFFSWILNLIWKSNV